MTNITLLILRIYVSTNFIPGYIGGPDPVITTNKEGYLQIEPIHAVAITHPPRTEVVTNYVVGFLQGTNQIELQTIVGHRREITSNDDRQQKEQRP